MTQTNSKRVSHNVDLFPNTFRDDHVFSAINDLEEMLIDRGHLEISRTGAFIDKITVWKTPAKLIKRAELTLTRPPSSPFVSSTVLEIYDEEGVGIVSTTTQTITRNGNNRIENYVVNTTRP